MRQQDVILRHMKTIGAITKFDSMSLYQIINLGNVILRLRVKHPIETIMATANSGRKFAIYSLDK